MRLRSEVAGFMVEAVAVDEHTASARLAARYDCMSCGRTFMVELSESPDALEARPGTQPPAALLAHIAEHEQ